MPRRIRFVRADALGVGNLLCVDTLMSRTAATNPWANCPLKAFEEDPMLGYVVTQSFLGTTPASDAIGGFTTTKATSGAVTLDAAKGLKIDAGAVTANQGVNLQLTRVPFTVAANKPVWMEARVRFESLTSLKIQFFLGLCVAQTAIITGGAVGTDDKIGFAGVTTSGVIQTNCTLSTTVTNGTGLTLTNSTTYRLGLVAYTDHVDFWVNDAIASTVVTNIPTAALAPAITVQANATVQPLVYIERLKVAGYF